MFWNTIGNLICAECVCMGLCDALNQILGESNFGTGAIEKEHSFGLAEKCRNQKLKKQQQQQQNVMNELRDFVM